MPEIITDLHLHSKYSRAVSQDMDLERIAPGYDGEFGTVKIFDE